MGRVKCEMCGGGVAAPERVKRRENVVSYVDGPQGIWGWNTIPILNLILLMCGALFTGVTSQIPVISNGTMRALLTSGLESYNLPLACLIMLELGFNIALVTLAASALLLVARRSASYPGMASAVFWISAVGAVVDILAARALNVELDGSAVGGMFRGVVFAMIWSTYFCKSVRIRNTFVNAKADIRKVAMVTVGVIVLTALLCWVGMSSCPIPQTIEEEDTEVSSCGP